jgi:hypothetical protein
MSKGFKCALCGHSSLVRSNFRLTPRHEAHCRDEDGCRDRMTKKLMDSESRLHVRLREAMDKIVGKDWTMAEQVVGPHHFKWIVTAHGISWTEPVTSALLEVVQNHRPAFLLIDMEFRS